MARDGRRYGKNAAPGYVSISARVPAELRKRFKKKLIDTDADTNTVIEQLVRLWVSGEVVIGEDDAGEVGQGSSPKARASTPRPEGDDPRERFAGWSADEFRRLREALGHGSAQSFSEALELNRTTWRQYETDSNKTPSDKVARRLAAYLEARGLDAEALLAEAGEA